MKNGPIENEINETRHLTNEKRRKFVEMLGLIGVSPFIMPFNKSLSGLNHIFDQGNKLKFSKPFFKFTKNKTNDGIIGPYGEVILFKELKGNFTSVPLSIMAKDDLASFEFFDKKFRVRIGKKSDKNSVIFNFNTIKIGNQKEIKFDQKNFKLAIEAIKSNQNLSKAAFFLRSVLLTSYPEAIKVFKVKRERSSKKDNRKYFSTTSRFINSNLYSCVTVVKEEEVIREITETRREVISKIEQYEQCVYQKMISEPCNKMGAGVIPCATAICGVETFIDIVKTSVDVIARIPDLITKVTYDCSKQLVEALPSPLEQMIQSLGIERIPAELHNMVSNQLQAMQITQADVDRAISFLRQLSVDIPKLAPYQCIFSGNWSVARLRSSALIGGVSDIPFGVEVCINKNCSEQLANALKDTNIALGIFQLFLGILSDSIAIKNAALEFLRTLGMDERQIDEIADNLRSRINALTPLLKTVLIILVSWAIILLYYGEMVSAQLTLTIELEMADENQKICISHPTVLVALALNPSLGASVLALPIVNLR